MRNSIKAIIIGAVILATAGTVQIWYRNGMTLFEPPTLEDYPIQGIDVSHHQGDIDWSRLAVQQEVRFAIIKATEGGDFRDRKFTENWQGAKHAGIVRGAYHFFTFCRPGRDQARNVIATVPREPDTLPIAVDIEFHGNCDRVPTVDVLAAELHAFMGELSAVFPGKPIFYVDEDFHDRYLRGNEALFPEHHLWLRSIAREPKQQGCRRWSIWQFADNGSLDGIQGPVDLNVLCASQPEFARLSPTGPEN